MHVGSFVSKFVSHAWGLQTSGFCPFYVEEFHRTFSRFTILDVMVGSKASLPYCQRPSSNLQAKHGFCFSVSLHRPPFRKLKKPKKSSSFWKWVGASAVVLSWPSWLSLFDQFLRGREAAPLIIGLIFVCMDCALRAWIPQCFVRFICTRRSIEKRWISLQLSVLFLISSAI